MRKFNLWMFLLLSCSANREQITEAKDSIETVETSAESQKLTEKNSSEINFLIDSLLNFNSESELKKAFGGNVKRSTGYYPEGMGEYQNTILFPETPNEVEFVWLDDSISFSGLVYVQLVGKRTDWKTKEGITLGTRLKELEKLNKKPFTFYGFGWDYSGMTDWDEGQLNNRKIYVNLGYLDETIPQEFEGLVGDHKMKSDSELAQNANPIVCELRMKR